MKREMRDAIPEVGGLDYAADFADDGVDGKILRKYIKFWKRDRARSTIWS